MYSYLRVLIIGSIIIAARFSALAQISQDKELSKQYMDLAKEMLEGTKAVDDARDNMVIAADTDTTNLAANFEAGYLHLITIGKDKAVKYLLRIFRQNPNYQFDLEYWIGASYQFGLEFDKAENFYNQYKNKLIKKPNYQGKDKIEMKEVDRRLQECKNGKDFLANPQPYAIVNIGREINSDFEDYAPVLNADETEIIFTTRRRDGNTYENVADDNKPYEDIFSTVKNGDTWKRAVNIGPTVNTKFNDSNLSFSPDGKTLFVYKDEGNGDIYYTERQKDGTWGELESLPGIINSSYRESSVSVTRDGELLYFASERPGGYGGSDIYVCTKDSKGEWSKVKNLGPSINTELDEDGPFIDYSQKNLYFSSKGRNGMGGFDIYKTTLINADKNEWSEPENMGYPINSPDDDIYFSGTKDGKHWYYSSVREDGIGYSDIYIIKPIEEVKKDPTAVAQNPVKEEPKQPVVEPKIEETKQPKTELVKEQPAIQPKVEPAKTIVPLKYLVKVVDEGTGATLDAKVRMQGLKDNAPVGVITNGNDYEFSISSAAAKDYRLSIEREGYIFQNLSVRIEGATTTPKTITNIIRLRKLAVGAVSILRNIYFDFDKATFKTEAYPELNKLESMMKQNQNLVVEIAGHTDNFGSKTFNQSLSERRANAVKSFLSSKGIDPRRVKTIGYGEDKPLASNDDEEEGRQLNRRVEFKVLGN
jgi:outer membrane protein OmpA-like peptidoglycan-associated protein